MIREFAELILSDLSAYDWNFVSGFINNLLIAGYNLGILLVGARVLKGRPDFKINKKIWLFFFLTLACGLSRLWLIENSWYGDAGPGFIIRPISSAVSIGAVLMLWYIVPFLNELPAAAKLAEVNRLLELKIIELDQALAAVRAEKQEKERVQNTLLQTQKMEAVGRLTGGIAHDFNNLLLAISGNLELIRLNPRSDRVDRWVGTGIDAVARAAHLTAQLLTFSRVQRLQLKEVQLLPLMTNLKTMIKSTLGPEVQVTLSTVANVTVMVDHTQLELAIINLAINSRDAMPDGGSLTLSATVDGDSIEIDVTDTGTGIPEDVATRVFEPFFTTKDIGKGTGLGLSMVYGVATQSGGDVYIKKTSPKGTTITISLPVVAVTGEPIVVEDLITPSAICGPRNILLIDDDKSVRETLGEILTTLGHTVTLSEDGVEALVHLKEAKPDLVLVDFAMPVMNGAEVMKAARLIHPDLEVVFITGFSESAALEGQVVMKKPFKIDDIEALLRRVFHCE